MTVGRAVTYLLQRLQTPPGWWEVEPKTLSKGEGDAALGGAGTLQFNTQVTCGVGSAGTFM